MRKDITVIIPTSVIRSHPSTAIIDETISNVRHHLPDSEIIIQIDGIRDEQLHRKKDYDEYKNRILWKCLHEWTNVLPIVFDEHSHQTTMMKKTIDLVKTRFLLYVESDTPLVIDEPIDWEVCMDFMNRGRANTIRFHHEGVIPKEHGHLMFGIDGEGPFMGTCQWSQRPHLSFTSYYRDVVLPISWDKTFLEDQFHGIVSEDYKLLPNNGGFEKHKLWIYHPNNKNIKRSYHLDGRNGLRKFTNDDISWGFTEE